jgi:hypothetical protein
MLSYPLVTDTPFVVTEPEVPRQLQADQSYSPAPSGLLLVPPRDPYTQLEEQFNSQGSPQCAPFGNLPSLITSYAGRDALFPLSSRESLIQSSFRNQSTGNVEALILIVACKMKQKMTQHLHS